MPSLPRFIMISRSEERQTSTKNAIAQQAIAYLKAHYTEKFSLDEMASALFVNKHYLSRVFKKETGLTPLQYHHRLRCEKAVELLSDPRYTIAGVALNCGFHSAAHFTRIFKLYKGLTPSEFRRKHLD